MWDRGNYSAVLLGRVCAFKRERSVCLRVCVYICGCVGESEREREVCVCVDVCVQASKKK